MGVKQAQSADMYSQDVVPVGNGEYMSQSDFNALSDEDKQTVQEIGVTEYNLRVESQNSADREVFLTNHVAVGEGDYVSKTDFDKLSPDDQDRLTALGVDQYNATISSSEPKVVEATKSVNLANGETISQADYDRLSTAEKGLLNSIGTAAFAQLQNASYIPPTQGMYGLPDGELIPAEAYMALSEEDKARLNEVGVDTFNVEMKARQDIQQEQAKIEFDIFTENNIQLPNGEWVDRNSYNNLTWEEQEELENIGTAAFNANHSTGASSGYLPDTSGFSEIQQNVYDTAIAQGKNSTDAWNTVVEYTNTLNRIGNVELTPAPYAPAYIPGGHEVIEELVPYTNMNGTQIDAAKYLVDNGVSYDTIATLQQAGVSNTGINAASGMALATIEIQPYVNDLAQYLRDKPNGTALQSLGYKPEDIVKIQSQAQSAPFLDDFVNVRLAAIDPKYNLDYYNKLKKQQVISYDGEVTAQEANDYLTIEEALPDIGDDYRALYGDQAAIGNIVSTPIKFVFAPARALRSDVTIQDISGAEWALGAGQALALASIPFGGITGGVIGKALDIGASAAFGLNTALGWNKLSTSGRILGVGGNLAFLVLPYALGRVSEGFQISKAIANPQMREALELSIKAGQASRKVTALKEAARAEDIFSGSALYGGNVAGALQVAEGEARMYTARLADALSHLDSVNPKLLKMIEQKSGMKIAQVTLDLGKAAKKLKIAQDNYDYVARQIPDIKLGTTLTAEENYLISRASTARNIRDVAQVKFDDLMAKYADILTGAKFDRSSSLLAAEREANWQQTLDNLNNSQDYKRGTELSMDGEQLQMELAGVKFEDITPSKPSAMFPIAGAEPPGGGGVATLERTRLKKIALESQIDYFEKMGVKPMTGTVEDLRTQLARMALEPDVNIGAAAIFPMSVLVSALTPETVGVLITDYGIEPENITGEVGLSQTQLVSIAQQLNISSADINTLVAVSPSALAQAVVYEAVKNLVAPEAQLITQAVISAYPDSITKLSTIPKIKEWQQISEMVATSTQVGMTEQLTALQLSQIQQAQKIIEDINSKLSINPAQQITPQQQQQLRQAQQVLMSVAQTTIRKQKMADEYPLEPRAPRIIMPTRKQSIKYTKKELRAAYAGGVALKAGFGYWIFKDPYVGEDNRHFFHENALPPRIQRIGDGKGSGYKSVQQFLDDHKITDFDFKMGIQEVHIHEPSKEPGRAGAVEYTSLTMKPGAQHPKRTKRMAGLKKPRIIVSRTGRWRK